MEKAKRILNITKILRLILFIHDNINGTDIIDLEDSHPFIPL